MITLNPAITVSRASIDLTRYKMMIEETGSNEARVLVIQYVMRSSLLLEYTTMPWTGDGSRLRWPPHQKNIFMPVPVTQFENGSSVCRGCRATRSGACDFGSSSEPQMSASGPVMIKGPISRVSM